MSARRCLLLLLATLALAAAALPADACPVCYGEAEDRVIDGTRWSVVFLASLVYLLFGGAAGIVFAQRRKVRRLAAEPPPDPRHGLHLVPASTDPAPAERADERRT